MPMLCRCGEALEFNLAEAYCPNGHIFTHSFAALVANAERELEKRYQVYPRLVARGDLREVEANHLIEAQSGTIAVLQFLQNHKDEFAEFLRQKRGAAPAPPPHHDPLTEVIR